MLTSSSQGSLGCPDVPHASSLLSNMEDLRQQEKLCDIWLEAEGEKLPAHRVVLSACSPYFCAMFTNDMKESVETCVTIKELEFSALKALVDFVYTGYLDVNVTNVQSLFQASNLLQIHSAMKVCCSFLESQLHPTNALGILNFAEIHSCQDLKLASLKFVDTHFMDVVEGEEFPLLPSNQVSDILCRDEIIIKSEEQVFEAVQRWVSYISSDSDITPSERQVACPRLLNHVRLPQLSPEYLMSKVEQTPFIRKNLACRDLVDEAKNYHLCPKMATNVMSQERFQPRLSTCGQLYVCGGIDSSWDAAAVESVEVYDLRSNSWDLSTPMSSKRGRVGVATLDQHLYAIGGYNGTSYLNTGERYDTILNSWVAIAPLNTPRRSLALGVLGGPMYALGGYDGASSLKSVERYDPQSNCWTKVASMLTHRGGAGCGTLHNFLFVAGGDDRSSRLNSVEMFDPHMAKWSKVAPMAVSRVGVGVATLNSNLYAVGGHDGRSYLNTVEMYDPNADVWKEIKSMRQARGGVGVCTLGARIFAVGGHDGSAALRTVECYDPRAGEWSEMASMDTHRFSAGVGVIRDI